MRGLVFWVLALPVAVICSTGCSSEANKRPEGPAPVYEPWVIPSWATSEGPSGGVNGGDALDALLDGDNPPLVPGPEPTSPTTADSSAAPGATTQHSTSQQDVTGRP